MQLYKTHPSHATILFDFLDVRLCSEPAGANHQHPRGAKTLPASKRSEETGKLYLTTAQWAKLEEPTKRAIEQKFVEFLRPIAESRSADSGIPAEVYVTVAAKESWFGTSFGAVICNNPFTINTVGKDSLPVKCFKLPLKTVKWNDNGTDYNLFRFKSYLDACIAYEYVLSNGELGGKLPEIKKNLSKKNAKVKQYTSYDIINAMSKSTFCSPNQGTQAHYKAWLSRVRKVMKK